MSYSYHRILTPGAAASRKRKEMEASRFPTSSKPLISQTAVNPAVSFATTSSRGVEPPQPRPLASNRLLAGYLAHEFLTMGTLFGQRFDPTGAGMKRSRLSQPFKEAEPSGKPMTPPESYAEVANLVRSEGVHIAGVVNPTQLARWMA